jgi:hypothetical protein
MLPGILGFTIILTRNPLLHGIVIPESSEGVLRTFCSMFRIPCRSRKESSENFCLSSWKAAMLNLNADWRCCLHHLCIQGRLPQSHARRDIPNNILAQFQHGRLQRVRFTSYRRLRLHDKLNQQLASVDMCCTNCKNTVKASAPSCMEP